MPITSERQNIYRKAQAKYYVAQEDEVNQLYLKVAAMNHAEAHFQLAYLGNPGSGDKEYHYAEAARLGREALEDLLLEALQDPNPDRALECIRAI